MPSKNAAAANAGAWGYAPPPIVPPAWVLQVTARVVRLTNRGIPMTFYRGERLPYTSNTTERAEREGLVAGGMLRRVQAVASAYDLNTVATAAAKAERARILAYDTAAGQAQPSSAKPAATVTAGGVTFLILP